MKKILNSFIFVIFAALAFNACSDVPAPYDIPGMDDGETEEGVYIDETFSTSLGSFTSISAQGNLSWTIDYKSACITGFQDYDGDGQKENQAGITYLVSPTIDLSASTGAYITFDHALEYERGSISDNNQLVISKDYAGDVNTANWEVLSISYDGVNNGAGSGSDGFNFESAGNISIPAAYIGEGNTAITVALRHTCTDSQSSTWEVQNFKVLEGTGEDIENPDDSGNEPSGEGNGDGTEANPYNVAAAMSNQSSQTAWVTGYIVGGVKNDKTISAIDGADDVLFGEGGTSVRNTMVLIADDPAVTDYTQCLAVNLPNGNVRSQINIQDNPGNIGKQLTIQGTLRTYFGIPGLRDIDPNGSFTLDGEGGGSTPEPGPTTNFTKVTTMSDGVYIIAAEVDGVYKVAENVTSDYGYLYVTDATANGNTIAIAADGMTFTFTSTTDGYTITDNSGRYYTMTGDFNSCNLTDAPTEGQYWDVTPNADGTFRITNKAVNKWMQYSADYTSYGVYPDERGVMPCLFKQE